MSGDVSPHAGLGGVEVEIVLPALLHAAADGNACVHVTARTVQGCFDALFKKYPLLRRHVFTDTGEQRPHVLFFHNEENTRWRESLEIPLRMGDTLTILQAVSGG